MFEIRILCCGRFYKAEKGLTKLLEGRDKTRKMQWETGLSNKIKADENFDANKVEWKLQLAIQQLPEKQRVVFSLRYYEEMPYEEMSRVLETSEGALKASYHHAVKKVEDYMLNH